MDFLLGADSSAQKLAVMVVAILLFGQTRSMGVGLVLQYP